MATRKVTITLDELQLEHIRNAVASGVAPSVSGFIQHAVRLALEDIVGWGALLADALSATGGPITADERDWADEQLGNSTRRRRRGSAA